MKIRPTVVSTRVTRGQVRIKQEPVQEPSITEMLDNSSPSKVNGARPSSPPHLPEISRNSFTFSTPRRLGRRRTTPYTRPRSHSTTSALTDPAKDSTDTDDANLNRSASPTKQKKIILKIKVDHSSQARHQAECIIIDDTPPSSPACPPSTSTAPTSRQIQTPTHSSKTFIPLTRTSSTSSSQQQQQPPPPSSSSLTQFQNSFFRTPGTYDIKPIIIPPQTHPHPSPNHPHPPPHPHTWPPQFSPSSSSTPPTFQDALAIVNYTRETFGSYTRYLSLYLYGTHQLRSDPVFMAAHKAVRKAHRACTVWHTPPTPAEAYYHPWIHGAFQPVPPPSNLQAAPIPSSASFVSP